MSGLDKLHHGAQNEDECSSRRELFKPICANEFAFNAAVMIVAVLDFTGMVVVKIMQKATVSA